MKYFKEEFYKLLNLFKTMKLKLVNCDRMFWIDILEIRNKEKKCFINQKEVQIKDHFNYMLHNSKFYEVCVADNIFAGFVGLVNGDIRIGVSNKFKRKGIGKFMLQNFKKFEQIKQVKIKVDNEASIKLFESLGFKKNLYIMAR